MKHEVNLDAYWCNITFKNHNFNKENVKIQFDNRKLF